MTIIAVIAIVLLCLMIFGGLTHKISLFTMIDEINRERREEDHVSHYGLGLGKTIRIFHEYRRIYPNGKLHIYSLLGLVAGVVSLIVLFGGFMLLGYVRNVKTRP